MAFSLSGSVITQANEAGISITAAASITGGVRFTCSQSYAAGNLVRITGTTNYNGDWIVDAVTSTTFDVKTSAQGGAISFVSSQTGTAARGDPGLSALSGISGVTTRVINSGQGVTRTTYVLAALQMVVTGSLRLRPAIEALEFGTSAPIPEMSVNNGGVLTVFERYGGAATSPTFTYGVREWFRITRIRNQSGQEHWDKNGAAIIVASGATFNWLGGSAIFSSLFTAGTTNIDFGVATGLPFYWVAGTQTINISYLTHEGGTLNINSLTLGEFLRLYSRPGSSTSPTYSNLLLAGGNSAEVEGSIANGGTTTGVYTLINPPDGLTGFLAICTRQSRLSLVNVPQGSSSSSSILFNDPTTGFPNGRIEFRKRVTFQFRTTTLANIQGVNVFARDTNNGSRSNRTNDTYTNDRTYLGTSNASGVTSQLDVMTAVAYPTSSTVQTPIYDRRSVSNNGDDVFRFASWSYSHQLSDLSIQMKGTGDLLQNVTMFSDASVTLSQSAAAALTSLVTLNDFYDAGKDWKCQSNSARLEYPTLFTQPVTASGTTLSLGVLNLIIDGAAASGFAINTATNTITVKATSLAVGAKFNEISTSGTISFANGGAATARLSGILTYGTPGAVNQTIGAATLRFSTAGTYDLRSASIAGTVTLVNTSGGAVTVQLQPGVTFVNSGPSLTVDNAVSASFTVSNIVSGSRLLIRRTDTQAVLVNEVVTGASRVYTYTHTANIPVEIVVRKATGSPAYQEWRTTATLTASGGAVTANQQLDE